MHTPRPLRLIRDPSPTVRRAFAGLAFLAVGVAQGQGPAMPTREAPTREALVGQTLSAMRALPPPDAADADIDTVIVRPDALAESDRRLAKLVSSLPGAEDPLSLKLDIVDRGERYFAGRADPNAIGEGQQQTILKPFESRNNNP